MQFFIDKNDITSLELCFKKMLKSKCNMQKIVFLCIGTEKVIGDAFGPIVGYLLKSNYNVFGKIGDNVNGINIKERINKIYCDYTNPYVIVVDAALGNKEFLDKIVIGRGGIIPGKALNKKNELIGNMYINSVVGNKENDSYDELKKANYKMIIESAEIVASVINKNI